MKQVLVVLVFALAVLAAGLAAFVYAQQIRFEQLARAMEQELQRQIGEMRWSEERAQDERLAAEAALEQERLARLAVEKKYKEVCDKYGHKE